MPRPDLDPWVRALLRCPLGLHPLIDVRGPEGTPELECAADCGAPGQRRRYPVVGGIPALRPDDATVVSVS